jgi:TetR/AcrR family transcriptional regulator, transcriptional repressor for nem operon
MSSSPSIQVNTTRGRCRPREFDMDEALDKAVLVFRERGYHGTSITDLTAAMALTSGSVYKAFKDKRGIFLAAFDRYKERRDPLIRAQVERGATGRERLFNVLGFFAGSSHGVEGERGCLVVGTATELATLDDEVAQRVKRSLDRNEALLEELIRQGKDDGSIATALDDRTAARLVLCVLQGMRVVGTTGRSKKEMLAVAEAAMHIFD